MAPECILHRYHWPKALTAESHHVIPQAWQRFADATRAGTPLLAAASAAIAGEEGLTLWDRSTVELCPTGHRNVHVWIVTLMKAQPHGAVDDPLAAKIGAFGNRRLTRAQQVAYDALTGFTERAHDVGLDRLRTARLWGNG